MKLIIELDFPRCTVEQYERDKADWHPVPGHPELVAVDKADIIEDPTDDCFFVFKLIEVKP